MLCLFSAESVDTFRRRGSKDHPCSQLPPVCPDRAHGMGSIRTHGPWPVPPGRATGFAQERPGCPPRRPRHKVLRSVVHHFHWHQGNSRRAGLYNALGLFCGTAQLFENFLCNTDNGTLRVPLAERKGSKSLETPCCQALPVFEHAGLKRVR